MQAVSADRPARGLDAPGVHATAIGVVFTEPLTHASWLAIGHQLSTLKEVEVWALWGNRDALGAGWNDVRAHCHPKEAYFDPLITENDRARVDGGRTRLIRDSLGAGWQSLRMGCPELQHLEDQLRHAL
jgi:hypothetical protein